MMLRGLLFKQRESVNVPNTDPELTGDAPKETIDDSVPIVDKAGENEPPLDTRANRRSADQQLLALMRDNPCATIARLTALSGLSRLATSLSLRRLERMCLVEHAGRGTWVAVDADLVEDGAPPSTREASWVKPLSGRHVARFTADGRVREDALTS